MRFSDSVEAGIDIGFLAAAVVTVVGLIGVLAGSLIEVKGYRRERAWLQELATQRHSDPPPVSLLKEYNAPSAAPFATVLGVVAGIMLPFSAGVMVLAGGITQGMASEEKTLERYSAALAPSIGLVALMLLFIVAAAGWNSANMRATHATRNALMARWPILPEIERNSEGKVTSSAAMEGPALTPTDEDETPTDSDSASSAPIARG